MHWIDPQSLPAIAGTVTQFIMNRNGALDGLILVTGGGETKLVHFPPHMGGEVENAIKAGDAIAVHGVKPRGAEVIAAVALVAANGAAIIDQGPDVPHVESVTADDETVHHDAEAAGMVRLSLYGPKGELRGAILEDGTVIRIGKKEASAFADLLRPKAALAARGTAIISAHGTMLDAEAMGGDLAHLQAVKDKKPKQHTEDDARTEA